MTAPPPVPLPRELLAAAVDRVLPAGGDSSPPGTAAAGVVVYLEGCLAEPDFAAIRGELAAGLERLEARAQAGCGAGFADLGPEHRDRLLRELETEGGPASRRFFQHLVLLTLEGFLADPARGGNRDGAGWRWMGYRPPAGRPDGGAPTPREPAAVDPCRSR